MGDETSKKDLIAYRHSLDKLVAAARKDLERAWPTIRRLTPEAARDALADLMLGLTDTYGNAAAAVAAQWFEDLRPSKLGPFKTTLAKPAPVGQVDGVTGWATRHLWNGDPENTRRDLHNAMQRLVEQPARDTIEENGKRDKRGRPRFARVPSGGKTCAFCFMLASRGFVYGSTKKAGGDGNKFHDDDRCMIVPGWGDNPTVAGYDPDAMYDIYQEAWGYGDTAADVAANLRRLHPEMFTDGIKPPAPVQQR